MNMATDNPVTGIHKYFHECNQDNHRLNEFSKEMYCVYERAGGSPNLALVERP